MKILFAASEAAGLAKTGGLADVVGSLPGVLAQRGHECALVMPLYGQIRKRGNPEPITDYFDIGLSNRKYTGRVCRSYLPNTRVPIYLIEQPELFERDDGGRGTGLYQFTLPNGQKSDYPDNSERFIFFCRAVFEAMRLLDLRADILHAHDWQAGLVPVYLREDYGPRLFPQTRSLFTIHNIAYQGVFWNWDMHLTGLDWRLFNSEQLEYHGQLNFLKGGIVFADAVSTVSPTYAKEIQTPYFGCGLQGVLGSVRDRLFGIVNGVDYTVWNPATDRFLAQTYTIDTLGTGKPACKAALQRAFGLPEDPAVPLMGVVARLVEQKGIELLLEVGDALLDQRTQLVILGDGDARYHRMLQQMLERRRGQLGLRLGFDETLAHQIEAGSDLFLMPSVYEPSGLNQLYSMKYATPPVVRATGGLADTVVDCVPATLADGTATGFAFSPIKGEAFKEAVLRALKLYREAPTDWLRLLQNCMRQDWSWNRSALEYEKVYEFALRR